MNVTGRSLGSRRGQSDDRAQGVAPPPGDMSHMEQHCWLLGLSISTVGPAHIQWGILGLRNGCMKLGPGAREVSKSQSQEVSKKDEGQLPQEEGLGGEGGAAAEQEPRAKEPRLLGVMMPRAMRWHFNCQAQRCVVLRIKPWRLYMGRQALHIELELQTFKKSPPPPPRFEIRSS